MACSAWHGVIGVVAVAACLLACKRDISTQRSMRARMGTSMKHA
jgi:hypothetical protein